MSNISRRENPGASLPIGESKGARLLLTGWAEDEHQHFHSTTEQKLHDAEARYRTLVEAMGKKVWVVNPNGETADDIGFWEETTGQNPGTIKAWEWLSVLHPDDVEEVERKWRETIRERSLFEMEYRIRVVSGEYRRIHVRGVPLYCDEHVFHGWIGTFTDVEDQRQAEEAYKTSHEQLRSLAARLNSAREEEGTRISRELHDELGGVLTSLKWDLDNLKKIYTRAESRRESAPWQAKIENMNESIDAAIQAVRRISSELRPGVLDNLGLTEAIEWQARQFEVRSSIHCRISSSIRKVELPQEHSTAVFRIFKEALTNILRHARATDVDIRLETQNGEFVMTVQDNGVGITEDQQTGSGSLGLLGMRERASLIGGVLEITGLPGKGTLLQLRVPLAEQSQK
jgi:two-component system sensor histidine kinase UhpB